MRYKYSYKVYEDCMAATDISESRARKKPLFFFLFGWIFVLSAIGLAASPFLKADHSVRVEGVVICLLLMTVSGLQLWYIFARYDRTTEKKINDAISKYIEGNKKFINSDKKIDSLSISDAVIEKQCMGCGVVSRTRRCFASKNGHKVGLPLCESCTRKLKARVKSQ